MARLGYDVADDDVFGIESVEDGDAAVADIPRHFANHGLGRGVAFVGFGEQGSGGFGRGHV